MNFQYSKHSCDGFYFFLSSIIRSFYLWNPEKTLFCWICMRNILIRCINPSFWGLKEQSSSLGSPEFMCNGFRLVRCNVSLQKCRYVSFTNITKLLSTLYEIKYQRHSLIKLAFELYSQEANMLILPISFISLS